MDPALGAALLALAASAVSAFVGYWSGRSRGERNLTIVIRRFEAVRDLNIDLAQTVYRLRQQAGALSLDEREAFQQIVNDYRKDAA